MSVGIGSALIACTGGTDSVLERALLRPGDLGGDWTVSTPYMIDAGTSGRVVACHATASQSRTLSHRIAGNKARVVQQTSVAVANAANCFAELRTELARIRGAREVTAPAVHSQVLVWTVPSPGSFSDTYLAILQSDSVAVFLNFGPTDEVEYDRELSRIIRAADTRLNAAVAPSQ